MIGRIVNYFKERAERFEKYEGVSCGNMVTYGYGENAKGEMIKSCDDVIDDIYRPFSTCDLKYYPHHGLYKRMRWDGAISSSKGERLVVPCGMGNKKPSGLYVKEFEYEVRFNIMTHKRWRSDGRLYVSEVTFPKMTDSYLFGGIINASNQCIDDALNGIARDIDCS